MKSLVISRAISRYRRVIRLTFYIIGFFILFVFLDLWRELGRSNPHTHNAVTAQHLNNTKSVYIASVQWNSEILLRSHWMPALLSLVRELVADHIDVFVSIYENDSKDDTKNVLSELMSSLNAMNVNHTINLDIETRDEVVKKSKSAANGWLETLYGRELRRIPYLANVRNQALKPLYELSKAGIRFDKILYINDIVYSVHDSHGSGKTDERLLT